MKKIVEYQCDICKHKYSNEQSALDCEAEGVFDREKFPIGTMFEYEHHDFVGIFAIADIDAGCGHYSFYSSWACRTKGYPGDTLGENMCGGGNSFLRSHDKGVAEFIRTHNITAEKTKCPEFKRMVEFLKSQKIQPRYYTPSGLLVTIH
jgi:hypothetical protein